MTQEGQGPRPEETRQPLTPPTSTRWSEEPVEDTADLAPPFVPGRDAERVRGPAAESLTEQTAEAVTAPASSAREPAASEEPTPFPFEEGPDAGEETGMPVAAEDEDFPFDQFDIEGDEEAAPAVAETDEPEIEGSDLSGGWITEAPDPDAADAPAAGEPASEGAESREPSEDEPEPWGEMPEAPAPWAETVADAVEEPPVAEPVAEPEPMLEGGEAAEATRGGAGEEIASLLERLARTIREEGEAGARREIDSSDRLTSLIAGLLAGHLSARS